MPKLLTAATPAQRGIDNAMQSLQWVLTQERTLDQDARCKLALEALETK